MVFWWGLFYSFPVQQKPSEKHRRHQSVLHPVHSIARASLVSVDLSTTTLASSILFLGSTAFPVIGHALRTVLGAVAPPGTGRNLKDRGRRRNSEHPSPRDRISNEWRPLCATELSVFLFWFFFLLLFVFFVPAVNLVIIIVFVEQRRQFRPSSRLDTICVEV